MIAGKKIFNRQLLSLRGMKAQHAHITRCTLSLSCWLRTKLYVPNVFINMKNFLWAFLFLACSKLHFCIQWATIESNKYISAISKFTNTLIHTINCNLKDQVMCLPRKEILSKQLHLYSKTYFYSALSFIETYQKPEAATASASKQSRAIN